MLFKKEQQIYTRLINMVSLLTNHETLYNLNIVPSFHPPFEPITAFLQLQVCGLNAIYKLRLYGCTSMIISKTNWPYEVRTHMC